MYHAVKSKRKRLGRFEIVLDTVERNGILAPFSYVTMKAGICVIPVLENGKIMLVREYRHPIRSWQYQFPSGIIDKEECPSETVRRELAEEVELDCRTIYSLGYTYPSFGSTDEKIYLFAADCRKGLQTRRETLELIETFSMPKEKVRHLVDSDLVVSAASVMAWEKYERYVDRLSDFLIK